MTSPTSIDLSALFRLDGRVAVVTGASSGLGDRFARVLHAAGATVVAAARRVDRLEALASSVDDGRIVAQACDVSVDADCEALIATTLERFGRIDVLVNNAGIDHPGPAEYEDMDEWRRVVDVNLNGLFLLARDAGRAMLAAGSGSIINVASVLGIVGAAPIKNASYTASKGAVVNLTRQLGAEWARKGVRVNALAPGWFPSEMTAGMEDDASIAYIKRNAPMGRLGAVHELDGALLYLASDASTYTTGHTLAVDGGWTAR